MASRFARSPRTAVALGLVLAMSLAACGTQPAPPATRSEDVYDASFPVTVRSDEGPVEIAQRPERIISLSPTATEMLFAIDAGDQVVAVDDQSDYPPGVPSTELSGYEPNIEAIVSYEPDLVVMDAAAPALQRAFERLEIPLLQQPAVLDLEGTYRQIEQLGSATGHQDEAEELTSQIAEEVEEIVASVSEDSRGLTYYHELDNTYFSVTSETFIGQVYSLVGLRNIADEARGAGSGYPQLSAEYIIDADPDLIFLADTECCDQSAETVAKRPGWDQITAVRNDGVVELSDDVASRWGPRVVGFLRTVADAVNELER